MSGAPIDDADPSQRKRRLRRWIGRGSAALADQGLFAVSNFLLNVLLARWLSQAGYGVFAVVFAGFLLIGTLHTALLTEPMLVFGSGKYSGDFTAYLGALIRLHWITSLVSGAAIIGTAGVAAATSGSELGLTILALAPVAPLILLTWLVRRACYARLQPQEAALGGLAYLVVMLAALAVLRRTAALNAATAILAMGVASIGALAVLMVRLGVSPIGARKEATDRRAIVDDHWGYGRWALGTALLTWVPTNLFILALPVRGGLEASGAFRALVNVIVPMMHASAALGILILPVLVRSGRAGVGAHTRLVRRLSLSFVAGACLYSAVVVLWGAPILDWLYDGRYSTFAPALVSLAFVPVFSSLAAVIGSSLRAVERPSLVFYAYLAPTTVAATVGMGLTLVYGVRGAGYGWLLTYAAGATALIFAFHRWRRLADTTVEAPSC